MNEPIKKTVKKRRLKKKKLLDFIFIVISLVFFIFCLIFYGYRLVKYYKIYNPKSENGEKISTLSASIKDKTVTKGPGLYLENNNYVYKGEVNNNYINIDGYTFRILKVTSDGKIDLVLDSPINNLMWNKTITDYTKSDIHTYINEVFIKTLDTKSLLKTTICLDEVSDIKNITCKNKDSESYVRLLSVTDYLGSITDKTTFINEKDSIWLSDKNKDEVWYIDGSEISTYSPDETYLVKPVITISDKTAVLSGDGTINKPYIIKENKKELKVGSYVKLGIDTYIVYENLDKSINLVLDGTISAGGIKSRFDSDSNIYGTNTYLGYYLNNSYYNNLSYKSIINPYNWNSGSYINSYKDVSSKTVNTFIGLQNVADLKFNLTDEAVHLITPGEYGYVYVLSKNMFQSKVNTERQIRPVININKKDIVSGDGTKNSPYSLGV